MIDVGQTWRGRFVDTTVALTQPLNRQKGGQIAEVQVHQQEGRNHGLQGSPPQAFQRRREDCGRQCPQPEEAQEEVARRSSLGQHTVGGMLGVDPVWSTR